MDDEHFMRLALMEAEHALREDEVPVGAVLVRENTVIASGHNKKESRTDPTAHAELLVIREAAARSNDWRFTGSTLYVTKEPCVMCAGALLNARLGRLVYGCSDTKAGAVHSLYRVLSDKRMNHQVEVLSGVLGEECALLLKNFFKNRR